MLHKSFINLRTLDFTASDLSPLTEVIMDLRKRHKPVVLLLAEAARNLKVQGILDGPKMEEWLSKFFNSRLGTEMLTKHYMALLTDADEAHIGIVDTKCNPARICQQAIDDVKRCFGGETDLDIQMNVEHPEDIEFSFISRYLFYIVEELLVNGICATLKRAREESKQPSPIRITVCADPGRVGIQISDKGGGVPFELSNRIWDYQFSTTSEETRSLFTLEPSPISGPGMGLSLCRIYVTYLGGSLDLMSMPGVGTDVYVFLNRIEAGQTSRRK